MSPLSSPGGISIGENVPVFKLKKTVGAVKPS